MKRQRIKTNIIELSKLHKNPPQKLLKKFKNGKLDAQKDIDHYGDWYRWLYENSDYDLIGWQIENDVFDWDLYSWAVAQFCPEYFDPDKFDWEYQGWAIAQFCPQYFDPNRYNWKEDSAYVVRYSPEHFDPDRYDWEDFSWAVAEYCPDKLDPRRYNWEKDEWAVKEYCPEKLSLKPVQPFEKNKS